MLGTQSRPGIMALTLIHLFRLIQDDTSSGEYQVNLSYLEIYNENIRDLLTTKLSETFLDLKETKKGVVVPGITTVSAYSANDVLNFLTEGNKHRTCESTGANEVSSRSHAILQVSVVYTSYNHSGQKEERLGKLSMIDLAGSERAAETNNRGIRMIEGASINRSLLALANCINALGSSKRNGYINYRDSKLTRLLKDSLGGNCKTVMIANISPASIHFDETQNTLKYASRAKLIKNKVGHHIEKYAVSTVSQLQAEIGLLKSKMHDKDFDKISMNDQDMSEFKGYLESVDDLFKQHDDLSIKISTIDLQITRNNILLRKQNELLEGFIIIGNEKKNFISNLELNIGKIKRANTALNTTKMEIMERFNEISNNIYIFQRNYTKSDGLDYKYLQLLIKNHFTITESIFN